MTPSTTGPRGACPYTEELDEVMSNFDHAINHNVAAALKEREAFARYPGWNFNALVWWDRAVNEYAAEVWVYHAPREVVRSADLQEIHDRVCETYGYD